MSNLFKPVPSQDEGHVPTMAGAALNRQLDSCCSPFCFSREAIRGRPVMGAPAFAATISVRPVLLSLVLYVSIIMISRFRIKSTLIGLAKIPAAFLLAMMFSAHAYASYITPTSWHYDNVVGCSTPVRTVADGTLASIGGAVVAASVGWGCHNGSLGPNVYSLGTTVPLQNKINIECYSPAGNPCRIDIFPTATACPANATLSGPTCACNTNYQPDPAGTSCVPKTVCTAVTKLDDITDPIALLYEDGTYSSTNPDIEHLTPATQAGLACIKQKVIATNCNRTPQATSGYRPAAYQKHIYDVYTKWQQIKDNNTPECAEVKTAIEIEFLNHGRFAREPGKTSNHSRTDAQGNPAGTAVDIALVPDNALISADAIACQCNMYRPLINMPDPTKNDPVHYQPRTCPR